MGVNRVTNISKSFAHKMAAKRACIDTERNYVTVTMCIRFRNVLSFKSSVFPRRSVSSRSSLIELAGMCATHNSGRSNNGSKQLHSGRPRPAPTIIQRDTRRHVSIFVRKVSLMSAYFPARCRISM